MSEITTVEDLRRENEQLRLELATAKARAVEEAEQAQLAKLERAVPDSVILVVCVSKFPLLLSLSHYLYFFPPQSLRASTTTLSVRRNPAGMC